MHSNSHSERPAPFFRGLAHAAVFALLFTGGLARCAVRAADWQPAAGKLKTRWTDQVDPAQVHQEYPRPQLVRPAWKNLNGLWQYAIRPKAEAAPPEAWDGEILVPFPVESALSGVMKQVGPDHVLWYQREFALPTDAAWQDQRILLHFGAVDWETAVWLNGRKIGEHRGGYDPFTFDITDALAERRGAASQLMIRVWDPSDAGPQPRGKQVRNPHGIWYTPTTGIWQTVWLEPVPKSYIAGLRIEGDIDAEQFAIQATIGGTARDRLDLTARCEFEHRRGDETVQGNSAATASPAHDRLRLDVGPKSEFSWWTPENPKLFTIELELKDSATGKVVDRVTTYSALRKIALGQDEQGVTRMFLNNKPYFQLGPLDQGFWPDGLYTAPSDEALRYDLEVTKQLGFNMVRKHVKVEPARWYYWCDKLGLLVWQDMPSGDASAPWDPFGGQNGKEIARTPESAAIYRAEWRAIIDALRNHPSIVVWVPFNEAWGQFDTVAVTEWTKEHDPTRLVNCASGGNDFPVGDILDLHRYPGPFAPQPEAARAAVLGEFGGLGLPLEGHTWLEKGNWGYRSFSSQEALSEAYLDLIDRLHPLIGSPGLSAAVYTQTTDVEIEVNGFMTYDRQVLKLPAEAVAAAHRRLAEKPRSFAALIPTSEETPQFWSFTLDKPADDWFKPDFDDAKWSTGYGGFGEATTPGSKVRHEWKSPDIWLRRSFELRALPKGEIRLRMHHDEDAEVYVNGVPLKQVTGYTTEYVTYRLNADSAKALKAGKNVLAVHCHQTGGGQYIDVGLVAERAE